MASGDRSASIYQPFAPPKREIRLLQFIPRKDDGSTIVPDDEIVKCNLSHHFLEDDPKYVALSYAWGDASMTASVRVNGSNTEVTENLLSALRHLAPRLGSQFLWIDALCINQSDDVEKSNQVQMMGSIYGQAIQVTVWLGPEGDGSDIAMKEVRQLAQSVRDRGLAKDFEAFYSGDIEYSNAMDLFVMGMIGKLSKGRGMNFLEMKRLVNRPWWQRLWVIQELILAKNTTIICGVDSVSWQDFFTAASVLFCLIYPISFLQRFPEIVKTCGHISGNIAHMTRTWTLLVRNNHYNKRLSLTQLFDCTCIQKVLQSTEPKDKIYGLLALMKEDERQQIIVDYSEFTTCARVFTNAAILMIRQDGLGTLDLCRLSNSQSSDLPSWVPNWACGALVPLGYGQYDEYCASGITKMRVINSNGAATTGRLILSGFCIDSVDKIGSWLDSSFIAGQQERFLSNFVAWFKETEELLPKANIAYKSEDERKEALWRTPICDRRQGHKAKVTDGYGMRVLAGLEKPPQELKGNVTQWRLDTSLEYRSSMRSFGSTIFISQQGYLGLGPIEMQRGDTISIFLGAKTPSIIRSGKDGMYQLVGEAYIHGMMDGQMMETNLEAENITLY